MLSITELEARASSASTLQESADVLELLLSGGVAVWTDGQLYNVRYFVGRVNGLKIIIHPNDHNPPHFHIKSNRVNASFRIDNCELLVGDIDGNDYKLIRYWHERNKELLHNTWVVTRPG